MRWFCTRKANIDPDLRDTFERYGVVGMQVTLASTNAFLHKGKIVMAADVSGDILPWLTEQFDRAERKETWLMTMEIAITLLVAAEVFMSILDFYCRHSK
ncbi:MAG: hypothetical protein ABSG40_04905 [Terriglobales bacterium]|jgi:hypothetical protein